METHWPLLAACWYCSLPSNSFHRLPSLSLPPSLDLPHTDRVKSLSKARLWSNSVLCGEMQRTTVARKRLWPCSPLCLRLFFFSFFPLHMFLLSLCQRYRSELWLQKQQIPVSIATSAAWAEEEVKLAAVSVCTLGQLTFSHPNSNNKIKNKANQCGEAVSSKSVTTTMPPP